MKANPKKIHFILLGNTSSHTLQISDIITKSAPSVVALLGSTIDSMIESEYVYCPLIWMFCLKIDMQRVEKVQ